MLAVLLLLSSHLAYSQTDAFPSQEAIGLASSRSVDAKTLRAGVQSALGTAAVAVQLPDPVLKSGVNDVSADNSGRFSTGTDFMTMYSVSVM